MQHRVLGSLVASALCLAPAATAVTTWSTEFPDGELGWPAHCAVIWTEEGSEVLIAGGTFTYPGGVSARRIARWNGERWTALGPGLGSPQIGSSDAVHALAVFEEPGGSECLFAAGRFLAAGGAETPGIARWNGSAWSGLGSGLGSGTVPDARALVVWHREDAGVVELVVAGKFATAGGQPAAGIAAWNGLTWRPLATGLVDSGGNPIIEALAIHEGDLVAAGDFDRIDGVDVGSIARFDGTSWSPLGAGVLGEVLALLSPPGDGPYPDRLIVGGRFSTAGGVAASCVATWDGATWSPIGNGFDLGVRVLRTFATPGAGGSHLYAGGEFLASGTATTRRLARWNGTLWEEVGGGVYRSPTSGVVRTLQPFDPDGAGPRDERLWVGGDFLYGSGWGLVRGGHSLYWTGDAWIPLGGGLNSLVDGSYVLDPDGFGPEPTYLHLTGSFTHAGEVPVAGHARWDGREWSAAPAVADVFGADGPVTVLGCIDVGTGPELYVTGTFTQIGGIAARNVARFDGAAWHPLGTGVSKRLQSALALGTDVVVRTEHGFEAGGVPAMWYARWDGTQWNAMSGTEWGQDPTSEAVFDPDGPAGAGPTLYAASRWYNYASTDYLKRWTGSLWVTAVPGYGYDVTDLEACDPDGPGPQLESLYLGGGLPWPSGVPVQRYDGHAATDLWQGGYGEIQAIFEAVDLDGDGPEPQRLFAMLTDGEWGIWEHDGSSWTSHGLLGGAFLNGYYGRVIEWDPDGAGPANPSLVATGLFRSVGDVSSGNIAIYGDGSAAAVAAPEIAASPGPARLLSVGALQPNPFRRRVTAEFTLARPARVDAVVHDVAGRRIVRLMDSRLPAGAHRLLWDGRNGRGQPAGAGVYFLRVAAGEEVSSRRVVLLR